MFACISLESQFAVQNFSRLTFYQYSNVQQHFQHFLMESFHNKFHGFLFRIVIGKETKDAVLTGVVFQRKNKLMERFHQNLKLLLDIGLNDIKSIPKEILLCVLFSFLNIGLHTSLIQSSHAYYNVPSKNRFSVKITFSCLYKA